AVALNPYAFSSTMDALMIGSILAWVSVRHYDGLRRVLAYRPFGMRLLCCAVIYAIWLLQVNNVGGILTVPLGASLAAISAAYLIASLSLGDGGGLAWRVLNLR